MEALACHPLGKFNTAFASSSSNCLTTRLTRLDRHNQSANAAFKKSTGTRRTSTPLFVSKLALPVRATLAVPLHLYLPKTSTKHSPN